MPIELERAGPAGAGLEGIGRRPEIRPATIPAASRIGIRSFNHAEGET
jgi:hypothetical protein